MCWFVSYLQGISCKYVFTFTMYLHSVYTLVNNHVDIYAEFTHWQIRDKYPISPCVYVLACHTLNPLYHCFVLVEIILKPMALYNNNSNYLISNNFSRWELLSLFVLLLSTNSALETGALLDRSYMVLKAVDVERLGMFLSAQNSSGSVSTRGWSK